MKRMVNDVPLCSVVGLLPGFTPIAIENRTMNNIWNDNASSSAVWEGLAKDVHTATDEIRYKWMRSKVWGIQQLEKAILFVISTDSDVY